MNSNLVTFLVFLENPRWVKFNRVYFTNFKVKVWKILISDFVVENSNKLQNLGLEGKISWTFKVFTLGPTTQTTLVMMNWWKKLDNFEKIKFYLNELILNEFSQCNLNWMQLN